MGGLAGLFSSAAGGAGAAGAAEGAAATGAASGASAAMSSGLGSAAAEGLANSAAQSGAMQAATSAASPLAGAGSLNASGVNALSSGLMESMFPSQWGAQAGGAAMPAGMSGGMPPASLDAMPDLSQAIPSQMSTQGFDMTQHSTGMPTAANTPARPNAFGQLVKDWFMNSSPIGRFVKGRLDARAALQGGLFNQGGVSAQIPQYQPPQSGFQMPQMRGGSPASVSRSNKLVQDLLAMVARQNGGMV